MYPNNPKSVAIALTCVLFVLFFVACTSKKNTATSRLYHSVNTRYNVHFNANEAFKESTKAKEKQEEEYDNLSQMLHVYPEILDSADLKHKGQFTTTIDKATKAIKLHSIKARPERDPGKRGDKEYQEWSRRKEFNPFLINTWMLLAKSEFHEGSYLRSITTFMYITKIYDYDKKVVSESKLWIARAYSEMGWAYEADNVLRKMEQNDEIHHQLLGMYASIKANIHVRNKQYVSALPYLEEAIRKEKSGHQKRRNRYLLGQLYAQLGEKEKAYQAFGKVRGVTSPFHYAINARLRQLETSSEPPKKIISSLEGMTKGTRNEDYLDQIYTALGNVYLSSIDTVKAIENYSLAVEKSKRAGYDKALAQIKVGGLHFTQQDYIKAQPHYSGALSQLKKNDEFYPIVSLRSEVLDQLVVHAKVVHEQDSLLMVANMPELERMAYIEKHIKKIKKEEEEAIKRNELAQRQDEYAPIPTWNNLQAGNVQTNVSAQAFGEKESDFYFYNKPAVEQGKLSFQRKWGKRPLEDNWRRKNKSTILPFGEEDEEDEDLLAKKEGVKEGEEEQSDEKENDGLSTDKYSAAYYLQQLPLTDAEKEESYKLIENGLFNMGLIYKNLLEDNNLAIRTFEDDLNRFPSTPNREEIYYQLFLIYLQMGNEQLMAQYRNKIVNEFSTGKYSTPLGDPNYAWNFKYMGKVQEDLYQETYAAYLAGDVNKVRKNYTDIQTKFPFVSLMPKFAFLHSLSYAQTKDAKSLEENLKKLISDHPKSDVTPLATNILRNIKDGMILLSDGTPISGMDWTMAYANDSIFDGADARPIAYRVELNKPYTLLLIFQPNSIDRNELLYEVADYNFSNYIIQTYDVSFDKNPILSALEITGFENFSTIKSYLNKAMLEEGLLTKIDSGIIPVPISADNYKDIYPRLGLEDYMTFYTDSMASQTPKLLAYWGKESKHLAEAVKDSEPKTKEELVVETPPVTVVETGEEKIKFPQAPEPSKEKKDPVDDKEVNLEELLTEDQVKIISDINKKGDDVVSSIQGIIDNPVDGLTNLFNRKNLEENLTKEEKEELKRIEKEEKERRKELARSLKAQQDSTARVEKIRTDSIKQVEKSIEDSIKTAEREKQQQIEFEKKERERQLKEQQQTRVQEQKDREETRKQQLRDREEARKKQEQEREKLLQQREHERNDLMKKREQERREKEKAAEELRRQRESERQELLKEQERKRKEERR